MENNSSLDPLGPEFGKVNAPAINTESMSPFEGDTPRDNKIDFFPVEPTLRSNPHPNYIIQDGITGHAPGKPAYKDPNKKLTPKEMQDAIKASFRMNAYGNRNKDQFAKINSYNAGPSGNSFYKRYAAYGQKKFDEIGFSPIRDNEAMYNAHTTMGDDFTRMMKNSFMPLLGRGFVSGPKSLVKMLQGDFSADLEDAKAYESAAAIGQSSKKGMGAFFNNTAMSFAYTAGIIGEAVLEEVAGALLAPVTGGGSFFAATANNARKIGKIGDAIETAVDGYNAVNRTIQEANNINGARKMWKMAQDIGKSKVVQFINPLENTFDAFGAIGKNADNLTGLARLSQSTSKTAGGLFRDMRNINMALSEARLEGGMADNAVYDKDYEAFYKKNGRAPNDAEQYTMTKNAKAAGVNTVMWNTALIFASNKIVIPNLLKSGISKRALQSKIDDVYSFKGGKVVFEKTVEEGKKIATGTFDYIEDSLINSLKQFKKAPIMTTAKVTGRYLKGNLMEGVQENLQDVIAVANENYYTTAYKNKELGAHLYNRALSSLMLDGLKSQFSAQGFETFASGALMGLFSGGLNLVKGGLDYGYNNTFNKEKYQEYKDARAKHGKDVASQLTALYKNPSEFFNSRLVNYGVQNNTVAGVEDADTKEAKDELSNAFMTQVFTALDTNTLNYFKDHIGSFKDLTPEEFEEAFGFEKGTGAKEQEKIDKIVTNIDSVEKAYNYANDRFPNPVDISNYKEGTPEYEDAALFHQAWKSGIKDYVLNNGRFMRVAGRMTSISEDITKNPSMKNMSQLDMNLILDPSTISNEVDLLNSEIETLRTSTDPKVKADLSKKEARVKALEEFADAHEQHLSRPQKLELAEAIFEAVKKKKNLDTLTDEQKIQILEVNQKHFEDAFGVKLNDNELQNVLEAEKGATLLNSKLEIAYKNYLKSSNGIDSSYIFDTDIDESFIKLKDYYKLNSESKELVKVINLLHNPQSFMDNVNKSRIWMTNMYNNREDYFIDMVNKQMEALESNEILNKLADMNIFLDLEQFQDFMENGVPPKEFLDNTTKQVIPIGTEKYNGLLFLLMQAKALREKNVSKKSLDEKLQIEIDKLEAAEKSEIDALDKVEVKGKATTVKKKDMTIKDVAVAVALNEFVDVTNQDTGEVITLFSSEEGLRRDDKDGDLISIKNVSAIFSQYSTYKLELKPDPKAAKEIEKKYNKLKEEAIAKYNAEKESGEAKLYSIYTPVQDLPEDLYKELQDAFNKSDNAKEVDELDEYDDEGILAIFTGFVQTNPVAKDIIDAYNAKSTEEAEINASDEIDEFEFKLGNKVQQTSKLSTEGLIAIRDQFKILRDKAKKAVKKEYYSDLINKLEKLISTRQRKGYTVEVQEKIKILKEKLVAQQKNIEKKDETHYRVKASGKLLERVTNFLQKLKSDKYAYIGNKAIKEAFNDTIDKQGLTEDSIDDFMNEIDATLTVDGFNSGYTKNTLDGVLSTSDNIRNYLEELLENKAEIPVKSKKELLADIQNFISENAYEYTRKAGNYLDAQLRSFFTPGGKPTFDESEISKEAFDELFGPDSYITKLKQKIDSRELFVLANNIKVYDEETGIAGEIDLLLIDKEGKLQIIDFKTGNQTKWNGFVEQTKAGKNKIEDYTLQQYTYARLLKKMTGLDAEINIMPLEITINQKEYKIASVRKPSKPGLLGLDAWYFPLDPNSNGIKDALDKEIKIKEQQTPPPTSNQSDIEGQVGTSNYSVIDGLIFYNNADTTVTPVPNTKGEDVLKVIKADIERRRQEELNKYPDFEIGSSYLVKYNWADSFIELKVFAKSKDERAILTGKTKENTNWKNLKDFRGDSLKISEKEKNKINAKYDAEIDALNQQNTTPTSDIEAQKADIEAAYSYITTRKYNGNRRDEVNKVGEDLAKRFVVTLKEKGLVKEGFRTAERTDGSIEKVKVNTDTEGNNLGNDWSTAGKFKDDFRKFVDAELAALGTPTENIDAKIAEIERRILGKDDRNNYPGIKELISVYNGGQLFFKIDASGFEVAESLKANNVTADDIFNIRNTISGKIGEWFKRGFEQLSGKTYEQYATELKALGKIEKQATKVSQLDLKKGDTVIVQKEIAGRTTDTVFASRGAVITVFEITEKGVKFKYMGRQKTLSLSEMDEFLTTIPIQETKDAEVEGEELDEIDKEIIADSIKVVKDFINTGSSIENVQSKANEKSLDDIYEDLLNDLDC